jgi:WD40 repeat protein
MNDKYLVSAGVDKVLMVWDHETGEKIARFGQQPNISAGLHLVHNKLISITIDGVVRSYDIGKGEMIRQFKISDLYKQLDLDTDDRKAVQDVGGGSGGSGMVQWASGSGSTVTVSSNALYPNIKADITVRDKDPHGHHKMGWIYRPTTSIRRKPVQGSLYRQHWGLPVSYDQPRPQHHHRSHLSGNAFCQ